jgi:RNA polymerase sigma factor (sigma-70 family)
MPVEQGQEPFVITKHNLEHSFNEYEYLRGIAQHVYSTNDCRGLCVDELVNEGWIALQAKKAAFDPSRGITLESYARRRVEGAMRDAIYRRNQRGYQRKFRPGQPAPIREIEYDDSVRGVEADTLDKMNLAEVNRVMIEVLSRRERTILVNRAAGVRIRVLAKKHGISNTRIRQIQIAAQEKVRKVIVRASTEKGAGGR